MSGTWSGSRKHQVPSPALLQSGPPDAPTTPPHPHPPPPLHFKVLPSLEALLDISCEKSGSIPESHLVFHLKKICSPNNKTNPILQISHPFIHHTQLQITLGLSQKIEPTLRGQGLTTSEATKRKMLCDLKQVPKNHCVPTQQNCGTRAKPAQPPAPPLRLLRPGPFLGPLVAKSTLLLPGPTCESVFCAVSGDFVRGWNSPTMLGLKISLERKGYGSESLRGWSSLPSIFYGETEKGARDSRSETGCHRRQRAGSPLCPCPLCFNAPTNTPSQRPAWPLLRQNKHCLKSAFPQPCPQMSSGQKMPRGPLHPLPANQSVCSP